MVGVSQERVRRALQLIPTLVLLMGFASLCVGCSKEVKDEARRAAKQAGSMFQEVLGDFKKGMEAVGEGIKEGKDVLITFKDAIREAKNRDAEFEKVYNKWQRVEKEVSELHSLLEKLVTTAETFFDETTKRANSITDVSLRDGTLATIQERRSSYIVRLKKAKTSIDQLDIVNRTVNDTMTALEIQYSLEVLEEKLTKTFEEIDRMVSAIMKDFEELIEESRKVLEMQTG